MAQIGASEDTRIAKLRDALQRARQEFTLADTIGQKPMCQLLGVTHSTLVPWLDDPMVASSGAFVRGGRGVGYEFNPVPTILALIAYFERQRADKIIANTEMRDKVGGDRLRDAPAEMTMREVRDAMQVSLQIRAAEKQECKLVDAAEAQATYRNLLLSIRDTLLGAPQQLDPTNTWSTELREMFDNALSDCLVLLREAGQDALSEPDATIPKRAHGSAVRSGKRAAPRKPAKPRAKRTGPAATA